MSKDGSVIKLTLKGDGLDFKSNISLAIAGRIIEQCSSGSAGTAGADMLRGSGRPNAASGHVVNLEMSPVEFITERDPKTTQQKVLVLGRFLEQYRKKEEFDLSDLQNILQEAREPAPTNLSRDVRELVSKGWVMSGTSQKAYKTTMTGQKVVEGKFTRDLLSRKAKRGTRVGVSSGKKNG